MLYFCLNINSLLIYLSNMVFFISFFLVHSCLTNCYYCYFSVTIESVGAMEPSLIFLEAIDIIIKKVNNALESALNQTEI